MSETSTPQWEIDQLVKARLFPDEQAVVRSALRALYASQPRLKRELAIRACSAGEISLGKAAEMLGVSHKEMKDILRKEGAEVHLETSTTEQLLRDAGHAYQAMERTLVELEEDIVRAAQDIAYQRGATIKEVLSDLAQRMETQPASGATRDGVPLFPVQPDAGIVTLELVNQLRDEIP